MPEGSLKNQHGEEGRELQFDGRQGPRDADNHGSSRAQQAKLSGLTLVNLSSQDEGLGRMGGWVWIEVYLFDCF